MSGAAPPRWAMAAALAAVYLIWGSTYLGIAIAVAGIPALASAGVRHLAAGVALLVILRLRGQPWPLPGAWFGGLVLGVLMLVLGNGLVCVAERHVPSGLTALLLAITPVFTLTGGWLRDGRRPTLLAAIGMGVGIAGVAVLCAPGSLLAPWWAYALIFIASLGWATGLTVSPLLPQAESLPMRTAVQMICGGAMLLAVAMVRGERLPGFAAAPASWLAVLYLAILGSMVAYTAYLWLQRHASPALATSNAYVNPLVALVLGAVLHGESLSGRVGLGAGLVVGAVALITLGSRRA